MTLSTGSRLGPYEILAPLGAGGMGEVYRGRDTRLGREVAIKVVSDRFASDPDFAERFDREARAVASLSHPNILTIHDVGNDGGLAYAVTELLEGESLRVRLSHAALSWQKAVEIGIAVAEGLAAAHSRGIIHRDIKPDNVFLTSDGRIKVLDFGLARQKLALAPDGKSSAPTQSPGTEPGMVLGTTAYMSPEQARGEPADAPSDIFSLGCLLFEMVSGKRPFQGRVAAEMIASILKDDAPALADVSEEVPLELSRIVDHCLEKNPNLRFQSARDLAFDLRAVVAAGASSKLSSGRNRKAIESLAVLPFSNTAADPETEYLSDGITETLITSLSRLANLRVMARSTVFRFKGSKEDPVTVGRSLKVRAVVTGQVMQRRDLLVVQAELVDLTDGSQLWGDRYSRPLSSILEVESEIASQISKSLSLTLSGHQREDAGYREMLGRFGASTRSSEAHRLYLKGLFFFNKRTGEGIRKGIEYFGRAIKEDPSYALAHATLGGCYWVLGYYTLLAPEEAFPKAKACALKALESFLPEARWLLASVLHYYDWKFRESEEEFRETLEINRNEAFTHQHYGNLLACLGRFDEGQAELHRALELDPLSLTLPVALAWSHYMARRYDEAAREAQKSLDMEPGFAVGRAVLGLSLERKGMTGEAVAELRKVVTDFGGGTMFLSWLGHAYASADLRKEAEDVLAELDRLRAQTYVSPYYESWIHLSLGDKEAALSLLENAFAERSHALTFLRVDPIMDPLRSDPRFQDLVRRVGFPP